MKVDKRKKSILSSFPSVWLFVVTIKHLSLLQTDKFWLQYSQVNYFPNCRLWLIRAVNRGNPTGGSRQVWVFSFVVSKLLHTLEAWMLLLTWILCYVTELHYMLISGYAVRTVLETAFLRNGFASLKIRLALLYRKCLMRTIVSKADCKERIFLIITFLISNGSWLFKQFFKLKENICKILL